MQENSQIDQNGVKMLKYLRNFHLCVKTVRSGWLKLQNGCRISQMMKILHNIIQLIMFYIPQQENSQYSQGFRKMLGRVLSRVKNKQVSPNPEETKNISSTIDYPSKRRNQTPFSQRGRNLFSIQQITKASTKKISPYNKIILPKLHTAKLKMSIRGIRGEELSAKFIRSSDTEIREMLHQRHGEIDTKNIKNISYFIKKQAMKTRNIKSQSMETVQYLKTMKTNNNIKSEYTQEQQHSKPMKPRNIKSQCIEESEYRKIKRDPDEIAPWALKSTSTNIFSDFKKGSKIFN